LKALFGKLGAVLAALRTWTVNIFTLILLVYFVGLIVVLVGKMPGKVEPEGKVLILAPTGLILEQEVYPTEFDLPALLSTEAQIQSRDLIRLIREAAADERLAGVVLDFSKASFAGPSTALKIAGELAAFRAAGKPVIAFSEYLTTASYLMAAQADEIYVHPSGAVAISGLGGYRDYTRELTEKLQITIHNYSQGDYKSAVEGLTRNDMSDPDRRQREELYAPIWASFKAGMARGRGLDSEVFQAMADTQPVVLANEAAYDNLAWAVQQRVIDGTRSFPDFRRAMIERFGEAEDDERETYPHISHQEYLGQLEPIESDAESAVAVVFVEGGIQPGAMGPGVAGSDDIARLIRKAYEDEQTRALVLRVNSPGGSIIASDMIRDELMAAKARNIPVVVSMGDVAASGGVWISTPADRIYAESTTITGSIGVAIAFPTLENVFDYIGVHFDGVTTSKFAGWGINQGVDEELDAIFAKWAGSAYERFISLVAQGRGKDEKYIRSIAGGRVWIATAAQERGLVDELGNMEDAIAAAAGLAGLEDFRINYVVQEVSPGFALLRRFTASLSGGTPGASESLSRKTVRFLASLEGLSQPRATVLCTRCTVELQ
jgi:protease-4